MSRINNNLMKFWFAHRKIHSATHLCIYGIGEQIWGSRASTAQWEKDAFPLLAFFSLMLVAACDLHYIIRSIRGEWCVPWPARAPSPSCIKQTKIHKFKPLVGFSSHVKNITKYFTVLRHKIHAQSNHIGSCRMHTRTKRDQICNVQCCQWCQTPRTKINSTRMSRMRFYCNFRKFAPRSGRARTLPSHAYISSGLVRMVFLSSFSRICVCVCGTNLDK